MQLFNRMKRQKTTIETYSANGSACLEFGMNSPSEGVDISVVVRVRGCVDEQGKPVRRHANLVRTLAVAAIGEIGQHLPGMIDDAKRHLPKEGEVHHD